MHMLKERIKYLTKFFPTYRFILINSRADVNLLNHVMEKKNETNHMFQIKLYNISAKVMSKSKEL